MKLVQFLTIVFSILLLTAQQDAPLRGPGRFNATATGLLTGNISGDVSAEISGSRKRAFHFLLDTDQMMKSSRMLSLTITVPAGMKSGRINVDGTNAQAITHDLVTNRQAALKLSGFIEISGKDLLQGSMKLVSTTPGQTLSLTGTFEKAPLLKALN